MIKKILIIFLLCINLAYADLYLTAPREFETATPWNNLSSQILNSNDQNIYIYWEGYGGYVYILENFIVSLQQAQLQSKKITFILTGNAYSAHAVAACYANTVVFNSYFLMFHPAAGPGGKVLIDPINLSRGNVLLSRCVGNGILLYSDVRKSLTFYEIYVYKKDGQYVRIYQLDRRQ